ncbi:MAG: glycosyltransferase [Pirellulaceae bacterium]|nr:glycosyltransferase [Pirellulaceae bacterium]
MLITAAICTYNRYPQLSDALASLRGQSLPARDYQILVVDNSPDRELARRFAADNAGSNCRFVGVDQPGLSRARNVAIAQSETPYLAFLDDDALASADWLARIVETFATVADEVAAVGGPADPIWEAPRPPWLHDDLLGYVGLLDWGPEPRAADENHWLIGTNVCYRRAALERVGGFRLDLGRRGELLVSNEELELQARLRAAGLRAWYSPEIRVRHRVPAERLTRDWLRRRVFWQAISEAIENPPPGENTARPSKWFSGETNSPRRFAEECRRLKRTLRRLTRGKRAA